jgi:hypothetical protein
MADVKSYAWSQRLGDVVPPGGEVAVPTPGFESPENYDHDNAEVVIDGIVLAKEQFSLDWSSTHIDVAVTNNTGTTDWQPGQTLYVAVAGIPFDPSNVEESFNALVNRVTTLEGSVTSLEARVTALESVAAR